MSFYSRAIYQDVGKNWKGTAILYLLMIMSLLSFPHVQNELERVSDVFQTESTHYLDQLPVINILSGKAQISEPVPYILHMKDYKTPFAIIDTSGGITSLENSPAWVLLTKEKLFVRTFASGIQEVDLKGIDNIVVDRNTVSEWLNLFLDFFAVVMFPIMLFILLLMHISVVLLCSLIGMRYARKIGAKLERQSVMRLSIVSLTPSVVLQFIHAVLNIPFPMNIPITFLVSMAYLAIGIKANAE